MLTILTIVLVALKCIETIAVVAMVVIGLDFLFFYNKARINQQPKGKHHPDTIALQKAQERRRKEQEAAAQAIFFENSDSWRFDSSGQMYYREMDRRADDKIFATIEEL